MVNNGTYTVVHMLDFERRNLEIREWTSSNNIVLRFENNVETNSTVLQRHHNNSEVKYLKNDKLV